MSSLGTILAVVVALALALALAYLPMRFLLTHMAKNIRSFIQRQRDRRNLPREAPDRRKAAEPGA
jgi:hypothetical protein